MEEEIKNEETTEEAGQSKTSQWIQDNMRVIISILIVVAIAGGIYSYSKRTEAPTIDNEQIAQDQISIDELGTEGAKSEEVKAAEGQKTEKPAEKAAPARFSQETENAFVETAGAGDSATVLARQALANYLEKNQDSALTAEHKIYIEDYLRKNVSFKGRVFVGTSIEFSKSLIQEAVAKSKNLNDRQLKNLHKYAVRVPSLS